MRNISCKEEVRLKKMKMNVLGTNYIHRSAPWTAAWWSAALPGFGHLYLGSYLKGLIFMVGEILINLKARINLAIFYTFIGNFEKANDAFSERWGLFYIAIWVFAIYDSYMLSVKTNQLCELEEMQQIRYFNRLKISPLSINFLSQREPWLAGFLSGILGGMGQIYNFHFIKGFILLVWVIVINYHSQFNHLLKKTLLGREIFLQQVNWQWLLFYPSIITFCIWDSYVGAIELNKLFMEEQRYELESKKKLKSRYKGRKYPMFLLGACKQSIGLELIINTLKTHGINKYEIIFLDRLNNDKRRIGDGIRQSDGISNFNGAMCGATVLMLFGTIWGGIIIPGGPIAIGLLGFLVGGLIGYLIDRYLVGWIRYKMKLEPIKGSNPIDGKVLILVKVYNNEQHHYVEKVFIDKDVRFVGRIEDELLKNLISS